MCGGVRVEVCVCGGVVGGRCRILRQVGVPKEPCERALQTKQTELNRQVGVPKEPCERALQNVKEPWKHPYHNQKRPTDVTDAVCVCCVVLPRAEAT